LTRGCCFVDDLLNKRQSERPTLRVHTDRGLKDWSNKRLVCQPLRSENVTRVVVVLDCNVYSIALDIRFKAAPREITEMALEFRLQIIAKFDVGNAGNADSTVSPRDRQLFRNAANWTINDRLLLWAIGCSFSSE
jgi:hypothetical protein